MPHGGEAAGGVTHWLVEYLELHVGQRCEHLVHLRPGIHCFGDAIHAAGRMRRKLAGSEHADDRAATHGFDDGQKLGQRLLIVRRRDIYGQPDRVEPQLAHPGQLRGTVIHVINAR